MQQKMEGQGDDLWKKSNTSVVCVTRGNIRRSAFSDAFEARNFLLRKMICGKIYLIRFYANEESKIKKLRK